MVRRAQAPCPHLAPGLCPSHLELGFVSNDVESCTLGPEKAWVGGGPVGLGGTHAC